VDNLSEVVDKYFLFVVIDYCTIQGRAGAMVCKKWRKSIADV